MLFFSLQGRRLVRTLQTNIPHPLFILRVPGDEPRSEAAGRCVGAEWRARLVSEGFRRRRAWCTNGCAAFRRRSAGAELRDASAGLVFVRAGAGGDAAACMRRRGVPALAAAPPGLPGKLPGVLSRASRARGGTRSAARDVIAVIGQTCEKRPGGPRPVTSGPGCRAALEDHRGDRGCGGM